MVVGCTMGNSAGSAAFIRITMEDAMAARWILIGLAVFFGWRFGKRFPDNVPGGGDPVPDAPRRRR